MIEASKTTGGAPHAKAFCDMPDCKREETVACAYHRTPQGEAKPDEAQIRKKLTGSGWSYIKGKLRCPACEAKRKVVPMKKPEKPAPLREPTRDQKREIMDMLKAAYDVSEERYTGGDTDETVADVLKVMPGWVAQIREDFFGPAGGNEDIAALMAEIEGFLGQQSAAQKKLDGLFDEITAAKTVVVAEARRAADYKARLARIEKAVGPRVMKRA